MVAEWASAARARPRFVRRRGSPWLARALFTARMMLASVASWRLEADALEGAPKHAISNTASSARRTDVTDMGLSLGSMRPTKGARESVSRTSGLAISSAVRRWN
jgi:hypothetical protein